MNNNMDCKILKFKGKTKTSNNGINFLLILEEKERKMGKTPILKEWFEIRNKIIKLKKDVK